MAKKKKHFSMALPKPETQVSGTPDPSLSATDFALPLPTSAPCSLAPLSIKKVNELKRRGENSRQWRAPPVCEFPTKEVYWSALAQAHHPAHDRHHHHTSHHHQPPVYRYKATLSSWRTVQFNVPSTILTPNRHAKVLVKTTIPDVHLYTEYIVA